MLTIEVPPKSKDEYWDSEKREFIYVGEDFPGYTLHLEHSLVAISKWESKWKKSFINTENYTKDEFIDYVRCMTLDEDVPDIVYRSITNANLKTISEYMNDPMTATTITRLGKKQGRDIITSELVYSWMVALRIQKDYETWHFNRLMMLIEVCGDQNSPKKKMSNNDILARNKALNDARRAKYHTKG